MRCIGYLLLAALAISSVLRADERPRVIVETDAGGDPDDEQALVRFLVYANEFEIVGIIANRPKARDVENLNPERTGLGIVRRQLEAYGKVYPRLSENAAGYPTKDVLWQRTVSGYLESEDGVNLVIAAADSPDPRPIWFQNWGTDHGSDPSCLKRALNKVRRERGPDGYAKFKARFLLCSDDRFGEHTTQVPPAFRLWISPRIIPADHSWHIYFSELTRYAGGFDLQRDVLTGHGALGALYPTNTTVPQKEGDAPAFVYLIPTGMNDPEHPEWGSWTGRYGPDPAYRKITTRYFAGNQSDTWHGTTDRANALRRWAEDIQNDFRARMAWCVEPYARANHRPVVILDGDATGHILNMDTEIGATVRLSASGSSDPDGNALRYDWIPYPEAGGYAGTFAVADAHAVNTTITIPADAAGHDLHIVLSAHDDGVPSLAAYRRIILHVRPRDGETAGKTVEWPGKDWATARPEEVGLSKAELIKAAGYAGGRGCVVRHGRLVFSWGDITQRGDVASAAKPMYSYFLLKALETHRITDLDTRAVQYEPRLVSLDPDLDYKDRAITLRELANQTSCYGVTEAPGTAFDYNDYQMALFVDVLFSRIYGASWSSIDEQVLRPLLTGPLQCEDSPTLLAFGTENRAGRLAISPRDFARFGLLYLREGRWENQQLLSPEHVRMAVSSPVARDLPRTVARATEMIAGQRTMGATEKPDDETDHHGSYSWLWWINGVDETGHRFWPNAPVDTYACLGHANGMRGLAVIPSLDLVISWNDTRFDRLPAEPHPAGEFFHLIAAAIQDEKK